MVLMAVQVRRGRAIILSQVQGFDLNLNRETGGADGEFDPDMMIGLPEKQHSTARCAQVVTPAFDGSASRSIIIKHDCDYFCAFWQRPAGFRRVAPD